MKKDYIAVVLGVLLTSMVASGASYVSTKEAVATQEIRLTTLEQATVQNTLVHKEINKTLISMNENNTQMRIALTRLATIIEFKVENKGG